MDIKFNRVLRDCRWNEEAEKRVRSHLHAKGWK